MASTTSCASMPQGEQRFNDCFLSILEQLTSHAIIFSLYQTCSGEAVEEAGASNFFAVFSDGKSLTVVTPSLGNETILPGITRATILELAEKEFGCHVVERRLLLADLHDACEAFCCGTGASITPVGTCCLDLRQ